MFGIYTSPTQRIAPSRTSYGRVVVAGTGITVVSVGYQNWGNNRSLFASQLFVDDSVSAYIQVVNRSTTDTIEWATVLVYYVPDGEAPADSNFTVEFTEAPIAAS